MAYTRGAYITSTQYASQTGRSPSEATVGRIANASRMLDYRLGRTDITLITPTADHDYAIVDWVANMVMYLFKHNDKASSLTTFKLGRFSQEAPKNFNGPDFSDMSIQDSMLKRSGLIDLRVHSKGTGG